ncbi:receptor expression-enhancing protein 4-like [Haemaphysalis longicornis]
MQCPHLVPALWIALLLLLNRLSHTLSRLIFLVAGALYLAYACCEAVRSSDPRLYVNWMMYWIVLALLLGVEPALDLLFFGYLPLYAEMKLTFVMWLQSCGASVIFQRSLLPVFDKYHRQIETHFAWLKARATEVVQKVAWGVTKAILATAKLIRDTYNLTDLSPSEARQIPVEINDWRDMGNAWDMEDW